jgi:signal transduction histidine kinase
VGAAVADVQTIGSRRRLRSQLAYTVAACGVAAVVATAWVVSRSPILLHPTEMAFWDSALVATWVAAGLYVWSERPSGRLGPLMIALGFLYAGYLLSASGNAVVYTLGMVVWAAIIIFTVYVWLSFPEGRLEWSVERWFVVAIALATAVVWLLLLVLAPTLPAGGSEIECGSRCPPNGLQIVNGGAGAATALATAVSVVFTVALIGQVALISNKARSPSRLRRRMMMPLAIVVVAGGIEFVTSLYVAPAYPGARQPLLIADYLIALAVPVALLVGLARARTFAAISLGSVASRASDTPMTADAAQNLIADSLGDPTLKLALWAPQRARYLDVHGGPVELPATTADRHVTFVTRDSRAVAALIHNPSLDADPYVVEGLTSTSLMLIDNARLVEEVHASRTRIAAAANQERLRLERDLHDGAQQRLMAIQIKLRLAQRTVRDHRLAEQLEEIGTDAAEAMEDLRTLAHGLYPSVLRDGGLVDAFRALAMRAAIPIEVNAHGVARCSAGVEGAVYFCALEAVQNSIKHAGPEAHVTITLRREGGRLHFAIEDDGAGMGTAAVTEGLGLVSMRDRIGAVGGDLEISSSPGRGTRVSGSVPDEQEPS